MQVYQPLRSPPARVSLQELIFKSLRKSISSLVSRHAAQSLANSARCWLHWINPCISNPSSFKSAALGNNSLALTFLDMSIPPD